jgi:uncharacterized membrane protein
MIPQCLNVLKAILFLISNSMYLRTAPMIEVKSPITDNISTSQLWFIIWVRISKIIPAVTSVDEWTKAETGVGAAIALGSHEVNGNCADLVLAAITRNRRPADIFK